MLLIRFMEEEKQTLKLFLGCCLLFAVLGAFNLYRYLNGGGKLSLVAAVVCGAVFIGWAAFYMLYIRRPE